MKTALILLLIIVANCFLSLGQEMNASNVREQIGMSS